MRSIAILSIVAGICALSTTANAQCCTYRLALYDTYGDGWQGATLEVRVNEASVGTYSAIGFGNTINFTICDGDSLELVYTTGEWETENAFRLFDASSNTLFADGPEPDAGTVFTTIGNCAAPMLPGGHPCASIPIDTSQCVWADNTGFPTTGLDPGCTIYQGSEIWFTLAVPASGSLVFETQSGTISDTGLGIWTGNNCDNLTLLGCDDDSGTDYYSRLVLEQLTPGQILYVQVLGYAGAQGSFQLCVTEYEPIKLLYSELPIVMINTLGETIVPDTKVDCLMDIKYNGPGNLTYVSDIANIYSGNIGIEIRGATSSGYPQKPFNIETRDVLGDNYNVSILGMPKENDWVLISNYGDRSLLRNLLPAKLFGEMGHYSTRFQLCEVLIDSSYAGIYLFGEKIKRDVGRVNIANLTETEVSGDDLTGGYILQQNVWDPSNSFQSNYSPINHPGLDIHFLYEYPDAAAIQPAQKTYIAAFIDSLETALYSADFANPTVGYRKYLDTKSFIDYFLVNELARNTDGFKKSIFYHKNKHSNGGKLKAGPVWDFDWAWKNISACWMYAGFDGSGWAHRINDCDQQDVNSSEWYVRLLQDSTFSRELRCAYEHYRQTILDTAYLFAYIDSMGIQVQEAQLRHFYKWPILGEAVAAPETGPLATTYYGELDSLKQWIGTRLDWLDANIPGSCFTTALPEISPSDPLTVYPNPAHDHLVVDYTLTATMPVSVRVYNYLGSEVYSASLGTQSSGAHSLRLETGSLPPGLYLLKLERGATVVTKKIVWVGE